MKKSLLFVLIAAFSISFIACTDDDDATATKLDVSEAACEKMADCDMTTMVGDAGMFGDAEACPAALSGMQFSETTCPVFDEVEAAKCIDAANALTCDEYETNMAPGGSMPAPCDNMCATE